MSGYHLSMFSANNTRPTRQTQPLLSLNLQSSGRKRQVKRQFHGSVIREKRRVKNAIGVQRDMSNPGKGLGVSLRRARRVEAMVRKESPTGAPGGPLWLGCLKVSPGAW